MVYDVYTYIYIYMLCIYIIYMHIYIYRTYYVYMIIHIIHVIRLQFILYIIFILHGSRNTDFFMLCSRSSMPTWLPEVLRFLAWGSQTGWLGLVCPAHCSASLPLLAAVFVSGLSLGALLVVIFLWISPAITVPCPGSAPSPTSRPHREPSRLLAYLHERRRPAR